ncbi:MAG: HEAT repeat domain-containing protein, partial [Phycisphaerae bacterium]|nr:HEAT repeat domain-containing protein [Phycisphaerae bacterium]
MDKKLIPFDKFRTSLRGWFLLCLLLNVSSAGDLKQAQNNAMESRYNKSLEYDGQYTFGNNYFEIGPSASGQDGGYYIDGEGIDNFGSTSLHEKAHMGYFLSTWGTWTNYLSRRATEDADRDMIKDSDERRLSYDSTKRGTSTNVYCTTDDYEDYACRIESRWINGSRDSEDWSDTGHQAAENINDANSDKIMEQLLSKEAKIHQQGRIALSALTAPNDVSGIEKYLCYKGNWEVRYEAVSVLTSIPGKTSTKRLLEVIFQDTNPAVISAASHSLKGRGEDIAKDEILKLLDVNNATVTRDTLGVIQKIAIDEAILKSLARKLEDKRWYIRTDTARALSKAKGTTGATKVNLILNAMKETCENPSSEGAKGEGMCVPLAEHMKSLYRSAILNMGDSAIEPLKERMGKEKNEFGKNLIVTLGLLGERSVYPDLIDIATKDENVWLRISAIDGLGKIGNKEAIPFLKEAL